MDQDSLTEELNSYLTATGLFFVPFIFNFAFCLAGSLLKVFFNKLNRFNKNGSNTDNKDAYLYTYKYALAFSVAPSIIVTLFQTIYQSSNPCSPTPYFGISFVVGLVSYEISTNIVQLAKWLKAVKAMMKLFKEDFSAFSTAMNIVSTMVETSESKDNDSSKSVDTTKNDSS